MSGRVLGGWGYSEERGGAFCGRKSVGNLTVQNHPEKKAYFCKRESAAKWHGFSSVLPDSAASLTAQMSVFMVFCGPHLPLACHFVCGAVFYLLVSRFGRSRNCSPISVVTRRLETSLEKRLTGKTTAPLFLKDLH